MSPSMGTTASCDTAACGRRCSPDKIALRESGVVMQFGSNGFSIHLDIGKSKIIQYYAVEN
jgi:hypothetical protein